MPRILTDALRVVAEPRPEDTPSQRRLAWLVLTGPLARQIMQRVAQ